MFWDDTFTNFVDNIMRYGMEFLGKFYGVYRGTVVSNVDQDNEGNPKDQGRIKVKVPAVDPDSEIQQWAYPMAGIAGNGYGQFYPPEKDDLVYVCFENGDPSYPLYIGSWFGTGELPDYFKSDNEPTARGFVSKAGHKIVVNDKAGEEEVLIEHKQGAKVKIDAQGNIEIGDPGSGYEPLVKGTAWNNWAKAHVHPTSWGPTSAPATPPPPAILSSKNKIS